MRGLRRVGFLPLLGLAAALGVVISAVSIRKSMVAVAAMQTVGVLGSAAQGDLQYYMQESRRRFVYAMTTTDPNEQLPYVRQARVADTAVQAAFETLTSLEIPKEVLKGADEFRRWWRAYLNVRDEVMSLILEGLYGEAVQLEAKAGNDAFAHAAAALQTVRHNLENHARAQGALVQSTLLRVVVELAVLLLMLIWLVFALRNSFRAERDQELANEREKNDQLLRSTRQEANRSRIMEMIVKKEPLPNVLDALCELVEDQLPGSVAAVSLFHDGQLREIAGQHFPAAFAESQYALRDPDQLAANRAALTAGLPVFSRIADDPMWDTLREDALAQGFLACWSHPVLSSGGHALGTVDVYFRSNVQNPEEGSAEVLRGAAHRAAAAIDHRHLYEELSFQAQRDALTELANRRLLQDRLEQAIALAERYQQITAVLMIDLDRFKQVNDVLGHRAGDALLRVIAQRLLHAVGNADTVARVGGDEFTVVLGDVGSAEEAERSANRILNSICEEVRLGEQTARVSASIGISLYPADGGEAATLIRNADLALYHVKSRGRNGCQLYGHQIGSVLRKRMSIEQGLSTAVQNGEFHLRYQPQVNQNGTLVGMEALLRWKSAEFGDVCPADFINVAEESGLIVPIGEWVLAEACRQSVGWRNAGHQPLKIAVNVAARQLSEPGFVGVVQRILTESGMEPGMLELELTETTLLDYVDGSLPNLRQLRDFGVTIAIDDFGTGYSSLSYLHRLPVTSVKIDQSFVREISEDSKSTVPVIQAIIELAHGMGLTVVGEGVETERQLQCLCVLGCDVIQGYLVSEPVAASEFERRCLSDGPRQLLRLQRAVRRTDKATPVRDSADLLSS